MFKEADAKTEQSREAEFEAIECNVVEFDTTVGFKMVAAELKTTLSWNWVGASSYVATVRTGR